MFDHLLTEIIFVPLAGALLILCAPNAQRSVYKYLALGTALLTFALSCLLISQFDTMASGVQFKSSYEWVSSVQIAYSVGVDGLSLSMIALTSLLFLLSVVATWDQTSGLKGYFSLLLLLETTLLGIYSAQDLFLFFTFWVASLLPIYLLTSIWGGGKREYAASKFFLYQLAGSAFLLLGLFAVYQFSEPHGFNLTELAGKFGGVRVDIAGHSYSLERLVFCFMFIAFAVRLPIVPLHSWFVRLQTEAPPALAVIIAAAFIKTGAYAILRINYGLFPSAAQWVSPAIAIASAVNVIYGGLCALGQKDLRRLVAYCCISHMGFVLLGLSVFSATSFDGALLEMFTQGVYIGLLLFLVGILGRRAGHFSIVQENGKSGFGGIVGRAPFLSGFFIIAVFSALGAPGLGAFTSRVLVFLGAFPPHHWLTALGLFGVFVTATYLLWMFKRVFLGTSSDSTSQIVDLTLREQAYLAPLILLSLLVGIYPKPLIELAQPTVNQVLVGLGITERSGK